MKKRKLTSLFPAAAMLALAGCGGDSAVITELKAKPFPLGTSLTYEQALDRREVCANTSWEVLEDSRGREVVRYECDLKGVDGFNEQFIAESSLPEEEISLTTGVTHIIEWFHNEGEYDMKDTRLDIFSEGESDESVELTKRISYKVAVIDEITELRELLAVISELRSSRLW